MRILLTSRSHPEGARDPYNSIMPTGLGHLNAVLRANGFPLRLTNLSGVPWRDVEVGLRREHPTLLGISIFTHNRFELLRLAALAKRLNSSCVTVLWGSHTTHAFSSILMENREVDAVVLGEGEETFLDLARAVRGVTEALT